MVNDRISDMLTRIRNATIRKDHLVKIPSTNITKAIAKVLKEEKVIKDFREIYRDGNNYLWLVLEYKGRGRHKKCTIKVLKRISKPGLRVYASVSKLPVVLNNFGIAIISTSKGIMTNKKAKEIGIGGEILCYIW